MTTSGTYAFNPANADLVLEAFERIGKRPNQLDTGMLQSATRSVGFMLSDWANNGVNLWEVVMLTTTLVQGTATYTLNSNVVQVLTTYITPSGQSDRLLFPIGRDDYMGIPNKTDQGAPTSYWFNRLTTPTLTLWQVPDGNGPYVLTYAAMLRQQDFAPTMAQTADLPYRFLDAFCADLAVRLAVKYAQDKLVTLAPLAQLALKSARGEDRELAPISYIPDLSGYYV